MNKFEEIGLQEEIVKAISELGFENPTPIQEKTIPVLLKEHQDFIGLAQTGTGKTAAFGLPLIQKIDADAITPQALVLAPTRELCVQIAKDIKSFSKYSGKLEVATVYGGASMDTQIKQLKRGAQIIVATPGRLTDLINRGAAKVKDVRIVVLDEADEMLNMGFRDELDDILKDTPSDKSTWLFSATMPKEVREIAKRYMNNPFELTVGQKNSGAENLEHIYYVVQSRDRYAALKRIIDVNHDIFGIVFCRTKMETQEVAENLIRDGYNADSLHGDLSQQQRDKVMGRYRQRSLQILVATDVAARGIDVNNVTHVIHYNLPDEIENYTHRSGRTARAGKSGVSIAIINQKEVFRIRQIEKIINKKFRLERVPDADTVCESQLMGLVKKVHNVKVDTEEISQYLPSIFEELNDLSKEEVITRFVSIEFNRFLEYYRNSHDININLSEKDHARGESEKYRSGKPRLFLNIGSMDGLDTGKMLGLLIDITGLDKSAFGRIDIKGVYSFIDVEEDKLAAAVASFDGEVFKGRRVRADVSDNNTRNKGKKSFGGGGSDDGFKKKRSYGGGGDRGGSRDRGGFGSREGRGGGYSGGREKSFGDKKKKKRF
ncbi:MAG TPA: DEAD/DEAH box helicase [Bacteroidia bacterium]|nr:DEAD/DEAH box helicase [Bacteroidia bacterium]HNU33128.1 DEAD/DEAH box helicase [Bacteroidia bacterium]